MTAARTYSVAELRYLNASMDYEGSAPGGQLCIQWSAALALDLRAGVLTFGTLRACNDAEREQFGPGAASAPFIHAWVEVGEALYSPTSVKRIGLLAPMNRHDYYALNGATDVRPLQRREFEAVARRHRLAAALKHGSPRAVHRDLVTDLLRAAGVRWVLSPQRGLLAA